MRISGVYRVSHSCKYVAKNGDEADWEGWDTKMHSLMDDWEKRGGAQIRAAVDEYVDWNASSGRWDDTRDDLILKKHNLTRQKIRDLLMDFVTATVLLSRKHCGAFRASPTSKAWRGSAVGHE